ncbi:MAG: glycosyltransferase family 2 protein [Candidatus Micrarchaeaceae archaeon]
MRPHVSIVIPTLNEEKNIAKLLRKLKGELGGYKYEIIVVDGHSKDKTASIAKSLNAKVMYDSCGKGSALIKGMHAAKGDIIISMDADLSNKPKEIPLLITRIEAGYDVCMGSRFLTGGGTEDMPLLRVFGNKIFVRSVNLLYGTKYTDLCYGYRSFSRKALRELNLTEKGFGIETEISIKAKKSGLKTIEIPSYEKRRANGDAKLRTVRDGFRILKTILKNLN